MGPRLDSCPVIGVKPRNSGELSNVATQQSADDILAEEGEPLSRAVPVSGNKLTAYRAIIITRLILLAFFFNYRINHPVNDSYGLWLISVICEIWFAVSWVLDQFPKWSPLTREAFPDKLSSTYEKEGDANELAPVDFFVSTVDPLKEPPITTANTVLSILAVDYPVDRVSCYVSDDGAAILTFQALAETAEFARKWVPFCKKYSIEPRAPEFYFLQKVDYVKDKVQPSFVKRRRAMKRDYEEFKVRINALVAKTQKTPDEGWIMPDGTPWPGNDPRDHPGMIQVFLGHSGAHDIDGGELPRLVYVSREKRPGFDHHKKAGAMNALVRVSAILTNAPYILNLDCDHYVNNSNAVREAMCFLMDPKVNTDICYVQFPQRFDGIDRSDRYANRNVVFFDINMKGLDGIQGPVYVGTGCVFFRQALYGYSPQIYASDCCSVHESLDKTFGHSPVFIESTMMKSGGIPNLPDSSILIREAIHVIRCGYEAKTHWGKEIGWIYGSVTEDILTGLKMHCRGWRSVYCTPLRPAFKGSAPINLSDRLHQVLRWALGSVEIFLSRHCPIWYALSDGRLLWLQRLAYVGTVVYPFTSFPLLAYCSLPAVCLLTGKFIIPPLSNSEGGLFLVLFATIVLTAVTEMRWSGVGMEEWWRNEQFWVISGVSAHLFAVFQGFLKVLAGVNTSFTVTAKAGGEEFGELYAVKWTALLVPPTTLVAVNVVGMAAGMASAVSEDYGAWGPFIGKAMFAMWVVAHLYPFLKGLVGRQNRVPTVVALWSLMLASAVSLLWVKIDHLYMRTNASVSPQNGLNA